MRLVLPTIVDQFELQLTEIAAGLPSQKSWFREEMVRRNEVSRLNTYEDIY